MGEKIPTSFFNGWIVKNFRIKKNRMSLKSKLKAGFYLAKTYITAMPRIVYRSTLSLFLDPKGTQQFIHQVLNAKDIEFDDPVLGSIHDLAELIGEEVDVHIVGSYYSKLGSDTKLLLELSCLAYLMQILKPKLVFEIGTYVGRTTRVLAVNAPPDCQIFTLDLPQEHVKHKIGKAFKNTSESERITQLYGDSLTFDFSPWYNRCDFVWVDGCHDYKYVVSDSQNALKLCRDGGWIAWHDYRHTAWWSGVTRAVREVNKQYPLRHIHGTTIALMRKGIILSKTSRK